MSVPALAGVAANDKSSTSQDVANSLVTGTIKAVGAGKAFPCWGPLNLLVYGVQAEALTITTAKANAGTVPAGTTQAVGDSVQSTLVPPGTTIKTTDGGGNLTFAFPTQTWYGVLDGSAAIKFPNGAPAGLQGNTLASLVGATVTDPNGYFGSGVTVLAVGADNQSLQGSGLGYIIYAFLGVVGLGCLYFIYLSYVEPTKVSGKIIKSLGGKKMSERTPLRVGGSANEWISSL